MWVNLGIASKLGKKAHSSKYKDASLEREHIAILTGSWLNSNCPVLDLAPMGVPY